MDKNTQTTKLQATMMFVGIMESLTDRQKNLMLKCFDRDILEALVLEPLLELKSQIGADEDAAFAVMHGLISGTFPGAVKA